MPLSGTGKHKYSFQRVAVPSLLPKTFCDCEEHSASLTPRETHARDLEAISVGINEEEVNIMNSVMNKLLKRDDSIIINEKDDSIVSENDEIIVDTKDNIVINVVSNGKDMMDTELDILSRKRVLVANIFLFSFLLNSVSSTYNISDLALFFDLNSEINARSNTS